MKNEAFPSYGHPFFDGLLSRYLKGNTAAQIYLESCRRQEWPLVIDHVALRCLDVDQRAAPFLREGYLFQGELVEFSDQGWWAKVYRKDGLPALFVDQAYDDSRGKKSIIPEWVNRCGDQDLHHAAVLVDDIDLAISVLEKNGVAFSGTVVGSPGSRLRQIFTVSALRGGAAYTVLELTERNGYTGFYPDQANVLMQSSTRIRSTRKPPPN